jgi:hypothetical protein
VVRDLQDLDDGQVAGDEGRVDLFLDVSAEEEAVAADLAEKDDRHVVDPGPAVRRAFRDRPRVWPEDAQTNVVDREPVARHEHAPLDPAARQGGAQRSVSRPRADHPGLQNPSNRIPPQERRETRGVVLVRVAQDDDIDPTVPWREGLVEGDEEAARIGSAIDEEARPTSSLDEDGVALPHVEDGQPGHPVGSVNDCDRQRCERGREAAGDEALGAGPRSSQGRASPAGLRA